MKKSSFYLILASFGITAPSIAADVTVAALEIPGLFTPAKDGAYDQILNAASTNSQMAINITATPPARAIEAFESGKVQCLTPADADFFDVSFDTIQSKPMNLAKVYAFSKAGSTPYSKLEELQGLKIGIRQGMPYGKEVEGGGYNLEVSSTIEGNIKKLNAGRLDVFLAYVPDAWDTFAAMNMEVLPHNAASPIAIHEDSVLCVDTPETRDMIAKIDAALDGLQADSTIKNIMGAAYIPE